MEEKKMILHRCMAKLPLLMLVLFPGIAPIIHAQDDILREMVKRADCIAQVKIIAVVGGEIEEAGVENWIATCRVLAPIKGQLKKDQKIKIDCSRLVWKEKEPLKFEKGKGYIVFLRGRAVAGVYHTIDHWVGSLPSHLHVIERTEKMVRETTKVRRKDSPDKK
jgi:hypothetical protein